MKAYPLNYNWQFSENNSGFSIAFEKADTHSVNLPHDYIINKPRSADAAGGPSNGFFGDGQGVYTKELDVSPQWKDCRLLLDIDGAYMNSEVALNGEVLAMHPHGYTPFIVDLTPAVKAEGKNILKVITNSRQPSTRWYSGGGLYRSVNLWAGAPIAIEPWDLFVTTPKAERDNAIVQAEVLVNNTLSKPANSIVSVKIIDKNDQLAASREGELFLPPGKKSRIILRMNVESPFIWDLDTPDLYRMQVDVKVDGKVTDTAEASFGIRSIEVDADNGFRLNHRKIKLKGGCIHHDNGFLGACAYPRAEERKIQILKAAGYNAVRISHYPPSMAMLEVCDRLGMLLLDEAFDVWRESKVPLDYHLYFEDWWERDITCMVLRDRNHPCVISYSIGNEIGERDGGSNGAEWSYKLAQKVRSLDNTRFVLSALCGIFAADMDMGSNFDANLINSDSMEDYWSKKTEQYAAPLDIVGYNYLYKRYTKDKQRFPGRVICGTETMSFYTYENWQEVMKNDHVIGDFIWVAYDYLGEAGVGRVLWPDGEEPGFLGQYPWRTSFQSDHDLCGFRKPQSYYREIMWGDADGPALFTTHPSHYGQEFSGTGWHWYDVHNTWTFDEVYIGKPVKVDAYTGGDEVEFILNGNIIGRAPAEKLISTMDIVYEPGTLEAVAYKNGEITGRCLLTTTGKAAAVRLAPDRTEIAADGLDLCFIAIELQDEKGNRVPYENSELTCQVSGAGELAGFGNGNPKSEDQYGEPSCLAFEGRALAIIKAGSAGEITVKVSAKGIGASECVIYAK